MGSVGIAIGAIPLQTEPIMTNIIKIRKVCEITALSKATIYREMKKGNFPVPLQLTERNVGWLEADINAWIVSRQKVDLVRTPEIGRVA